MRTAGQLSGQGLGLGESGRREDVCGHYSDLRLRLARAFPLGFLGPPVRSEGCGMLTVLFLPRSLLCVPCCLWDEDSLCCGKAAVLQDVWHVGCGESV